MVQIDRLNWALEAYSRSVTALIHFQRFEDLLARVCEAIVAGDHYALAVVGLQNETGADISLVGAAGKAVGYASHLRLSADEDRPGGQGPTGLAIRSGQPVLVRDTDTDPLFAPWRDLAAQYGIRSSVTVPFKRKDRVVGALIVYGAQPDAFGPQELDLFSKLVGQMAFALEVKEGRVRLADAEASLAQAARDYKLLADHASDYVLKYGPQGDIQYASPSWSKLGWEPQDLVGRNLSEFLRPAGAAQLRSRLEELFSLGVVDPDLDRQLPVRRGDGGWVWLEGSPQIVRGADGKPVAVITQLRDVTQRRAMEEELRRKTAEAEAASAAKTEFLANMSHEIRTPLTAILGFGQLLQKSSVLQQVERRQVDHIVVAGRTLLAIVNDVLEFSRLEAGEIELHRVAIDPIAFIGETLELVADQARAKGLALTLSPWSDPPKQVEVDQERLRQVLLNLLSNAIKFTDSGKVEVSASYLRNMLCVTVRDTGVGVSPEQAGRLFQRFSQGDASTTRRHGGSGLGLAIAKALVTRMGGDIGFDSEPGQGASFWFTIEAPEVGASRPSPPILIPQPAVVAASVLVVDDAPTNRELLGAMLDALEVDVTFAENGEDAVAKADEKRFDLVLMDMQMPVMDGLEATRRIRAGGGPNRATPILAVSANVLPAQVEACKAAGMNDHLAKPIDPAALFEAIDRWMGVDQADTPAPCLER